MKKNTKCNFSNITDESILDFVQVFYRYIQQDERLIQYFSMIHFESLFKEQVSAIQTIVSRTSFPLINRDFLSFTTVEFDRVCDYLLETLNQYPQYKAISSEIAPILMSIPINCFNKNDGSDQLSEREFGHDLNNLLLPIMAYSDLLLERISFDAKAKRYVEKILVAAEKAYQLVYQFTHSSKKSWVNLSEIIQDVVHVIEGYQARRVTIHVAIEDNLPLLWGSSIDLYRVILNICLNACQAMGEKGSLLEIQLRQIRNNQLELCIKDDGVGISQEHQSRLFTPYFSTSHSSGNKGLGLTIVQQIIKEHSGHIQVESQVDRGTQFYVFLPLNATI